MSAPSPVLIAGSKTTDDWQAFCRTLAVGGDAAQWEMAFREYFLARLRLRYLDPIKILQENSRFEGEGFSIAAIQCTLIEFLESTLQGISYRYAPGGKGLGPNEYSSSKKVFVDFLCNRQPFSNDFDETLAESFYVGVRCGLLHEARTKNGWRIWAQGPVGSVVSRHPPIVYRNNFQTALETFIDWYRIELQSSTELQEAFIRRFDSLCR